MKLKINLEQRAAFSKALKQAEGVAALRTTLPILNSALISTGDGNVSIQTTNLDQAIVLKVEAEVIEKGDIGMAITDVARIADNGRDCLEIYAVKNEAVIKSEKSVFKLPLSDVKDFPPIMNTEAVWKESKFSEDELRRILECVYAASNARDNRYILQGVCLNLEAKQGIGCDGKMLALSSYPPAKSGFATIIPDVACRMMLPLIEGQGEVSLRISESQLALHVGSCVFYTKLIEGNYPSFQQKLPKVDFRVKVSKKLLVDGINQAAIAESETSRLTLTFSEGEVVLSVQGANASSEISVKLHEPSPKKAHGFSIAINSVYLKKAALSTGRHVIELGFVDNLTPMSIEADNYAIIMPIRSN